jgi:hypothetical protein
MTDPTITIPDESITPREKSKAETFRLKPFAYSDQQKAAYAALADKVVGKKNKQYWWEIGDIFKEGSIAALREVQEEGKEVTRYERAYRDRYKQILEPLMQIHRVPERYVQSLLRIKLNDHYEERDYSGFDRWYEDDYLPECAAKEKAPAHNPVTLEEAYLEHVRAKKNEPKPDPKPRKLTKYDDGYIKGQEEAKATINELTEREEEYKDTIAELKEQAGCDLSDEERQHISDAEDRRTEKLQQQLDELVDAEVKERTILCRLPGGDNRALAYATREWSEEELIDAVDKLLAFHDMSVKNCDELIKRIQARRKAAAEEEDNS